jgi:hypothetical protein
MSTLVPPPSEATVSEAPESGSFFERREPDLNVLQDRIPPQFQLTKRAVVLVGILGLLFTLCSYQPLWHSDLWGHLSYGRWIWQMKAVPRVEPLMPLAQGVPFIDIAWLSQLAGYGMINQFGVAGAQFLYAGLISLAFALVLAAVYRRTGSLIACLATLLVFGWGCYQQLLVIRPQLAGLVCFAVTLVVGTSTVGRRWHWWAIPLTFALWANLHGSFPVGLGLLGLLTLGRIFDVVWRVSIRAALRDSEVRRLFLLTQIAAASVLLNPYGVGVYGEVFAVANNPNLEDLFEWAPLSIRMAQGKAAVAITIGLFLLYRMSPRRVTCGEVLAVVSFGLATLWTSRFILWWGPLVAYYVGVHLAAIRWKNFGRPVEARPSSGLNSVLACGLAWIFFAFTPFGNTLLHGQPKDPKVAAARHQKALSRLTPLGITDHLNAEPPVGQVFNTYEWGDYLTWAGPNGMQLFLNSHAHLVPREVWQDYMAISAASNWEAKFDNYSVNTVVVDQQDRSALIRALKSKKDVWELSYEDGIGAVFRRIKPL